MGNTYLQAIVEALVTESSPLSPTLFCTETKILPTDMEIIVNGIGQLRFPIDPSTINSLLAMASKAKFGLCEKTLWDESVRDTYEIDSHHIKVKIRQEILDQLLNTIRHSLGLSDESKIIPHLHNLLIYGPGQFFDKHQDSEKLNNMIASLVIILPSPHIGGNLIIEHGNKTHIFSSENIDAEIAPCIAFYADCQHQVEKIKQGYRIALTYNLVLDSTKQKIPTQINPELKAALSEYFEPVPNDDANVLVYLLDHSYSEHSLRWDMLKGADRINGSSFYAIAQASGYRIHLALAEIRESWSTDGNDDNPALEELIEDEINLSYWIDSDNHPSPFKTFYVKDDMLCWTKATEDCELSESEYEGYMGNYGNTMDYWYRRAAIVIWPESHNLLMHFKLNYENALQDLLALTSKPGNEQLVLNTIKKVGVDLYKQAYWNKPITPNPFLQLAVYIKNEEEAFKLLSPPPFTWAVLSMPMIPAFVHAQQQYGKDWCLKLLQHWKDQKEIPVLKDMESFTAEWVRSKGDMSIIAFIIETQADAMIQEDLRHQHEKPLQIEKGLPHRFQKLEQLLLASASINNLSILPKLFTHVESFPALYPETHLANLLLVLKQRIEPAYFAHYQKLKEYVLQSIQQQIAAGLRDKDDWSIVTLLPCKCELCKIATQFLRANNEVDKVWPIVTTSREHIMQVFDGMGLPVKLSVEKKGSPYKLVLVKTPELYKNAQRKFTTLTSYYQSLTSLSSHSNLV